MAWVTLLAATVFVQVAFGQDEPVDNPEYAKWSSCKPGSWVTFEQPCGKNALMQETYKLLELSAEKAVFECTKVENGFKYPLFQRVTPAKFEARDLLASAQARKPDGGEIEFQGPGGKQKSIWRKSGEGDEEIEIAGRRLKCHWVEMDYRIDSAVVAARYQSSVKTWYSKEIPGQVAKIRIVRVIQGEKPEEIVVDRLAKDWRKL